VNADKSPEKGLGYYNDYDAVVYTPNSELNTRAMVKITRMPDLALKRDYLKNR
jgi:hypothetical protein